MKISFFIHIFVTCYMYGSPDFLSTESIEPGSEDPPVRRLFIAEDTVLHQGYERMFQAHVFPLFVVGVGSLIFTILPSIIPFLSLQNLKAFSKMLSGKEPPKKYYAPGYSSTFHSLLTEEQAASVAATGKIPARDEKNGYRLNKKR